MPSMSSTGATKLEGMTPAGAKLLIVDDDDDILVLLKAVLEHAGFQVRCANDGTQALAMVREEKPRLMITDVMMPGISGVELCRALKKDPALNDVILFVLSARGDLQTKLECLSIGVEEYLVKPVHSLELSARVSHFLKMIDGMNVPGPLQDASPIGTEAIAGAEFAEVPLEPVEEEQEKYGAYRVVAEAGKGGMGTVLKAYDEVLERQVAIKILAPQLSGSPEFAERFRREAKALAAINHPGIASIYNLGIEKDRHFFAMQWCSGGSLHDLLKEKQRLDPVLAIEIILQCAHALDAAAKKGIVHRDIKPTNILFDEEHRVKIVDFGLARSFENSDGLTQSGLILGTPEYISPEQAQGKAVDYSADLYALGITFYRMLSGRLPFSAASQVDTVLLHISAPFPAYREEEAGFMPKAAYDIIHRMTQKQPDRRYDDYSKLIRDLERVRGEILQQRQFKIPTAAGISSSPDLSHDFLFDLLARLDLENRTGVLTVQWSSLRKRFLVREHSLVLYESLQPAENIWPRMVERAVLPHAVAPDERVSLEEALSRLVLTESFKREEFKRVYGELMRSAMMEIFSWPDCRAEFRNAAIDNEAFAGIPIRDILIEAARSVVPKDGIESRLPRAGLWKTVSPPSDLLLKTNLQPEEWFLLSRLEGGRMSASDLQATTGLPRERVDRILFALERLKLVQFEMPRKRPTPRKPPPEPSRPVPEEVSPAPPPLMEDVVPSPSLAMEDVRVPSAQEWVRMEVQKSDMEMQIEQQANYAEQYFRTAEQKWEEGDYWQAANLCEKAIRLEPERARYHHLRGLAYAKHPRFQKQAELAFREAVRLAPDDPEHPLALAELYLQGGLPVRAAHECRNAIRIAPNHERALHMLAELQEKKKQS